MSGTPQLLVIRRRYLGDVVLLGSLLRNLRLHWPAARLAVAVEPQFADVLGLNPDVDDVLTLPTRLRGWPDILRRLRRARYTHVLDLDNTEKTAAITRISGAGTRVALHHGAHRVRLRRAYTHVIHDPGAQHETRPLTEYYLRALEPLAVPIATRATRLIPREADLAAMRAFIGADDRILLVHPGSRSPMRIWPAERFAAVCDLVGAEFDARVVLAGGPGDRPFLAEIQRHARRPVLIPDISLPIASFAALARLSRVLLCHDSGPMHVAAAVGARVVALYGSQNAALFRPAGEAHVILQPALPCTACVAPHRCIPGDSYRNFCVRNISVAEVVAGLRQAWGRADNSPKL